MKVSRQHSLYLLFLILTVPSWATAIKVVLPTIQFEEDSPFYISQIHGDPIAVVNLTIDYDMVFFTKVTGEESFISRSNMTNVNEAKYAIEERNRTTRERQWEHTELQSAPIRNKIIKENAIAAMAVASSFIKRSLKAPATSDFVTKRFVLQKDGTFLLFGEIDAQNGFGATIRNGFRIEIQPTLECTDYYKYSCWNINDGPVITSH